MNIFQGLRNYWKEIGLVVALAGTMTYGFLDSRRIRRSIDPFLNAVDLDKDGYISEQEELEVYRRLGLPEECQHRKPMGHTPNLNILERRKAYEKYDVQEPPLLDLSE